MATKTKTKTKAKEPSAIDHVIHEIEVTQAHIEEIRDSLVVRGRLPIKSEDKSDTLAAAWINLGRIAEGLQDIA
jgi:5-enolpyruvylshikimate-3-phosphate synthase